MLKCPPQSSSFPTENFIIPQFCIPCTVNPKLFNGNYRVPLCMSSALFPVLLPTLGTLTSDSLERNLQALTVLHPPLHLFTLLMENGTVSLRFKPIIRFLIKVSRTLLVRLVFLSIPLFIYLSNKYFIEIFHIASAY